MIALNLSIQNVKIKNSNFQSLENYQPNSKILWNKCFNTKNNKE